MTTEGGALTLQARWRKEWIENSKVSSTEQVVEGLGQNDEFKNEKSLTFLMIVIRSKKFLILKPSDCVSMKSLFLENGTGA